MLQITLLTTIGMNVMMYYIVFLVGMAGLSGSAGLIASSIQYVINVTMTVPALLVSVQ
jgi:hypothetical protein